MGNIIIINGDITSSKADAIVNAAKPSLEGGSGVDGAIHYAAGPQLLNECLQIPNINGVRCPTGEARLTNAGTLQSRYVIHTVGPIYLENKNPSFYLKMAYINCIEIALENDCKSIAFPAISCGNYGYPVNEASMVAIETCLAFTSKNIDIYFYLIDSDTTSAFKLALQEVKKHIKSKPDLTFKQRKTHL
ncbi:macro domain-containing protein [Aeromonas hydrophila]|uniref:macro domain-containing protein n=1 Tax=Aeromonas hydrophila TaxID=644 RepID=UPI003986C38C